METVIWIVRSGPQLPALPHSGRAIVETVWYRPFVLLIGVIVTRMLVEDGDGALTVGIVANLLKTDPATSTDERGVTSPRVPRFPGEFPWYDGR